MKHMHSLFREAAVSDRADRLAIASLVLHKPVASSKDLSEEELEQISAVLEQHVNNVVHLFKRAVDGKWEIVDKRGEPRA